MGWSRNDLSDLVLGKPNIGTFHMLFPNNECKPDPENGLVFDNWLSYITMWDFKKPYNVFEL
jgi:hypothetical protein